MLSFSLALTAVALTLEPPVLTVDTGQAKLWSREALLSRPGVTSVHVNDPAFGGAHEVSAIALSDLMGGLTPGPGTIQVTCSDGFVADLPRAQAAQRDPHLPIAYLAIDPLDGSWPNGTEHPYPGPFAVVWSIPPGQSVPREQWPNQVIKLAVGGTVAERYPALAPSGGVAETRGFQRFVENCLPCHSLNDQGPARVGPDLNLPQNPTEYFSKPRLAAFVRDPQSLHHWQAARMPAFSPVVLSDADLADLLAYLADRAKHR